MLSMQHEINETNQEQNEPENKEFNVNESYDIIIKCDSLRELNSNGWELLVNPNVLSLKNSEKLEDIVQKVTSFKCIAVSGGYNAGKTFVVNGLSGNLWNLPSNFSVHTEGLSIKRFEKPHEDVLLLDSAGANSTIEIVDEKVLADKICSEKILNNAVRELANFHICVVNQLTWADQRHFEELTNQIQKSNEYTTPNRSPAKWPLFVIHNFRERRLDEVKCLLEELKRLYPGGKLRIAHFEPDQNDKLETEDRFFKEMTRMEDLYGSYSCTNMSDKKPIWKIKNIKELRADFKYKFWFDANDNEQVRHVFLVKNEGAAQIFNMMTFEYVRDTLINATGRRDFSLTKIVDILGSNVRRYVSFQDMDKIQKIKM